MNSTVGYYLPLFNMSTMPPGEHLMQHVEPPGGSFQSPVEPPGGSFHPPVEPPGGPFHPPPMDTTIITIQLILQHLHHYYKPSIISIGLITNCLCLLIIIRSQLIQYSYNNYIVALLCADQLYLLNLLSLWMAESGYNIYRFGAWCHFSVLFSQMSSFLCLWYHVCLLVDRYIALHIQCCERVLCTSVKAKIVSISFCIVAIAVFLNISLTVGIVIIGPQIFCTPLARFTQSWKVLDKLDIVINGLIPYSMCLYIAVMSLIIGYREGHMTCTRHHGICNCCHMTDARSIHETDDSQWEKGNYLMTQAYTWIHLLLTLPVQMFRWIQTFSMMVNPSPPTIYNILLQQLFSYPSHTLPAINFFILLIFYSGFRTGLTQLFKSIFISIWKLLLNMRCDKSHVTQGKTSIEIDDSQDPEGADLALTEVSVTEIQIGQV